MVSGPSWVRSENADHQRICARARCGEAAVATLRFQPRERAAWLIAVDQAAASTERDLCARHAEAVVLPTGWQLFDARAGEDDSTPSAPGVRRPLLRARRADGPVLVPVD